MSGINQPAYKKLGLSSVKLLVSRYIERGERSSAIGTFSNGVTERAALTASQHNPIFAAFYQRLDKTAKVLTLAAGFALGASSLKPSRKARRLSVLSCGSSVGCMSARRAGMKTTWASAADVLGCTVNGLLTRANSDQGATLLIPHLQSSKFNLTIHGA